MRDAVYRAGVDDEAHRGYYASLRLCDPRVLHGHARELVELSGSERLARRLAALPQPARYLAGVPRGVVPHSLELLTEAGVPVVELTPSGHWPFIDRPDEFAAALREFLDGLD
jgi:pimeloyl-ACP methyl ester carboxylesterase